jgi:hypothetical protein
LPTSRNISDAGKSHSTEIPAVILVALGSV